MSEGKLYQVLLVDDDLLVLDDLKTMIDWEEEGFQIAAIAHNGEEALACMKETLIDIIIVDIEMPLLNGLDFLRQLYQQNTKVCALLLTAYSRFDYAREAVALGVSNYILKYELTPELLLENLYKMSKQSDQLKVNERLTQHQLLHDFLHGHTKSLPQIMPLNSTQEKIILVRLSAALAFNELLDQSRQGYPEQKNNQNETLFMTQKDVTMQFYSPNEWEVYGLLSCEWNVQCYPNHLLEELCNTYRSYWQHDCFMVVASPCSIMELPKIYAMMQAITCYSFYLPLNRCCNLQAIMMQRRLSYEQWKEAANDLFLNEQDEAIEQIQAYLRMLKQYQPPINEILLEIQDLIHQLQRLMSRIMPKDNFQNDFKNWQKISNYTQFNDFIQSMLQRMEAIDNQRYSRKVLEMLNFIQHNCGKENVLEELDEKMNMNREYMSKLFKKETGQSLSQSLQAYRLKKAYLLLTTTHLKIYEIAEQCGYNSSQYFSMVFTKYYQCSPSDVMNQSGGDCDELER